MNNPEKLATKGTQDDDKQVKHNTICGGHHYGQTNTHNVNKTCALLQTTGGKDVIILFIFPFPIICIDIQYNTIPEGTCPCIILPLNESND